MGDTDFFDVPSCRIEKPSISFSDLTLKEKRITGEFIVTKPGLISFNQTKDRQKYNNKLVKQLQAIGVHINEKTGQVESESSNSHSDYFIEQVSNIDETLTNLVDETLDAISESEKKMDSDDELSNWNPMKEAFEQRHFNSYQEPGYDTPFAEKHNPVRGTKISPAKGSEDEVTLFISNIPMQLSEDGLRHMFGTCGRCRRVKKCRPKIPDANTTYGFVAYSSVREAEEAITKFDRFPFGREIELRVRLSHGRERNVGVVPNSINIQLGSAINSSENEGFQENLTSEVKKAENNIPNDASSNLLFPNMFLNQTAKQNVVNNEVINGPRLYIQGIHISLTSNQLAEIINEITPCTDVVVLPPKTPKQFTTFGFVTVKNVEDAELVINHFKDFGKIKVTYSEKSAKEYGKDINTEDDLYYLNLCQENARFNDDADVRETKKEEPFTNYIEKSTENNEPREKPPPQIIPGFEVLNTILNVPSKVNITEMNEVKSKSPEDSILENMSLIESNISKHNYLPIKSIKKKNPISPTNQYVTFAEVKGEIKNQKPEISSENELPKDSPTTMMTETASVYKEHTPTVPITSVPSNVSFIDSSLPSSVNPLEYLRNVPLQCLYSDSYDINITDLESPDLIWGCLVNNGVNHQNARETLAKYLSSFLPKNDNPPPFFFKAGTLSVVNINGEWKRGLVTKIEENVVSVFLIDEGHNVECQPKQLRTLPKYFQQVPAQAIPMKLFNVKPLNDETDWPADTIDYLRTSLLKKTVIAKPEFKDKFVFAVKVIFDGKELDKLLVENEHAKRFYSDLPQINPGYKDTNNLVYLSEVIDIELVATNEFEGYIPFAPSPKQFFCRTLGQSNDIKIDEIEKEIQRKFQNKELVPLPGIAERALCAVKIPGDIWHRGYILKVTYDYVIVFLIDYGSNYKAAKDCIFFLPSIYQEVPAQAIRAQLQYITPLDYSGYSSEAIDRFNKLVSERVLIFKVVNKTENIHRVIVFDKETGMDIGKKLVDEGLAKLFEHRLSTSENHLQRGISGHGQSYEVVHEKKPDPKNTNLSTYCPTPRAELNCEANTSTKSPPRGLVPQNKKSQLNSNNKSPLGRGMIMGRGLALLKERGLLPQ